MCKINRWALLFSLCALSIGLDRPGQAASADLRPQVADLLKQLEDDAFPVREKAERELRVLGYPAFLLLRVELDQADVDKASRIRRVIGDYDGINRLLDALPGDWHETLYYDELTDTQRKLVEHGEVLVPYLADRIAKAENPLYRFNLVTVLDKMNSPEAMALLRLLAKDEHPWTRVESVWSLGNHADKDALPLLLDLQERDPDETVRKEARMALAKALGVCMVRLTADGFSLSVSDHPESEAVRSELKSLIDHYRTQGRLPDFRDLPASKQAEEVKIGAAGGIRVVIRLSSEGTMDFEPEILEFISELYNQPVHAGAIRVRSPSTKKCWSIVDERAEVPAANDEQHDQETGGGQ